MTDKEKTAMIALCDAVVKLVTESVPMGALSGFPEKGMMVAKKLSVADCRAMAIKAK